MYPTKGYWRYDKSDSNYLYCKNNEDACLGNDKC